MWVERGQAKYSFAPLVQISRLIRENKIDILHCHLFRSEVFGWLTKAFVAPQVSLICHDHGAICAHHPAERIAYQLMQSHVACFLAVSHANMQELIRWADIGDMKIQVLHNPIDSNRISKERPPPSDTAKLREALGIRQNEFWLGFAARLEHQKGCEYAIHAMAKLDFPAKLTIFGDGSQRTMLEHLARKLRISEKVAFMGYTAEVRRYLAAFDAFLLPSRYEGFSIVILECLSLGTPIIASEIGGVTEIITADENGLLFKTGDVDALVHQMRRLKNDPELARRIADKGRGIAKEFGLDVYLKKLSQIYESVLSGSAIMVSKWNREDTAW